jgi:hypothetical protein
LQSAKLQLKPALQMRALREPNKGASLVPAEKYNALQLAKLQRKPALQMRALREPNKRAFLVKQ